MAFDNRYCRLPPQFYRRVEPTPLHHPFLVSWNESLAAELGIEALIEPETAAVHLGAMVPLPGSEPIAAVYAGHQFGHYVPQLGDGRSILLGEWISPQGERRDLHLKGGGVTPYSRMGDGRAVLRSTIREYLCSEAMHGLGIPTTRALCIIGSEEEVARERIETGATLLRSAPHHIRFGTFEYFYHRGEEETLRHLLDYLVTYHEPDLRSLDSGEQALALFQRVCERTAALVAQWQLVGFAHGVMNSDNMSLQGITLDFGPFGFVEAYDPGFICNHSDHGGRYAFDQQPLVAEWNLRCLAQALLPLIPGEPDVVVEQLREELGRFSDRYHHHYDRGLAAKLGLSYAPEDHALYLEWLQLLQQQRADYTRSFRALSTPEQRGVHQELMPSRKLDEWLLRYRLRLQREPEPERWRLARMRRTNPRVVLRNYLAQQAIEQAEAGVFDEIERLLQLLQNPYEDHPGADHYADPAPDWAHSLVVSCSS